MKLKILLLISLALVISCKPKVSNEIIKPDAILRHKFDSVNVELNTAKDSIIYLNNLIKIKNESYKNYLESLRQCDSFNKSLRAELFIANYKLGRIKEYCELVRKDNTQIKFLRSWINRVLED